jgi:hypothetical protein
MPDQERATAFNKGSACFELGGLIVTAAEIDYKEGKVRLVVGRPGFPNVTRTLEAGGAILFETPDDGVIEVRVLRFRDWVPNKK